MGATLQASVERQQDVPGLLPALSVVVPCYNEAAVLPDTIHRLSGLLQKLVADDVIAPDSCIWFVDDGSSDATWNLIANAAAASDSRVAGIKLSRNRGHQIALLAGLLNAPGDVIISIDADLQDDLRAVPRMIASFSTGFDIVYGVKRARAADSFLKRYSAEAYYRLLLRLGVEVIFNHADCRLLSRRAVESLRQYGETNVFLRALIPQLGYRWTTVEYEIGERLAGESKYSVARMLSLAWQGLTSFSVAPLRVITGLGATVSLLSIGLGLWALGVRLFTDDTVPGWASIVIPIFLLTGVQLLSLGVVGEYVAKIYVEVKRRPLYFIDRATRQLSRDSLP